MTFQVQTIERIWPQIAPMVFVPHTETDYLRLVGMMDELIDLIGEDERHPLASLLELVGELIEKYEAEHVPELIEA
ncbi:MAG: hypothetical protein L0Y55_01860 [Anaerolineales bacterium]|nr:hypothetical protein [Anaerolineales bacterium]